MTTSQDVTLIIPSLLQYIASPTWSDWLGAEAKPYTHRSGVFMRVLGQSGQKELSEHLPSVWEDPAVEGGPLLGGLKVETDRQIPSCYKNRLPTFLKTTKSNVIFSFQFSSPR